MIDEGRVIRRASGTQIAISSRNDGAMEALIRGRVCIVDSVLCLTTGGDGHPSMLLLPHDTEVVAEDPLVLLVLGRIVRVGDDLVGGGGGVFESSSLLPKQLPGHTTGWPVTAFQSFAGGSRRSRWIRAWRSGRPRLPRTPREGSAAGGAENAS